MKTLKLCTFLALLIQLAHADNPPEIITPLGKLVGKWQKSLNGRDFMAFEGVPFAKPPIGKHRFADPVPVTAWKGVWNATKLHTCSQIGFTMQVIGSEDCLYLNIYVPRVESPLAAMDVIVHIHGGAFMIGSGHDYAKPGYIMDRDVIFVTFNYRLGVLGFLSTGDEVAPGNVGLKDQQLALQWVQENIAPFGGNPESVTITGMSAGGASVHFHYLSPRSKGLFRRGISHSGTALNFWALQPANPLGRVKLVAQRLGCPIKTSKELMKCLKTRPTLQILETVNEAVLKHDLPSIPFVPIVDGFANEPVVPEQPKSLLKKGKFHDLEWISSNTVEEGVFFAVVNGKEVMEDFYANSPRVFLFPENAEILKKIKDKYAGEGQDFTKETVTKLFTDRYFNTDIERATKLQAKMSESPVYHYNFNYTSEYSFTQILTRDKQYLGVSHMDDGLYMYPDMVPDAKLDEDGVKLKNAFIDMLVSYAKTGTPKMPDIEWKSTSGNEITFLKITNNGFAMETSEEIAPVAFWETLTTANSKDEL